MPIVTFKYKDTIISTPNLEKKLKRMKLSLNDIEIIDTPINKKEEVIEEPNNLKKIIIQSSLDKMQYISFVPMDFNFPAIEEFFKKYLWNPSTKTGIKEFTPEYIKTLYYVK